MVPVRGAPSQGRARPAVVGAQNLQGAHHADASDPQILLLSPKGEVMETRRFSIPNDRLNMESIDIALGEKLFLSYQVRLARPI